MWPVALAQEQDEKDITSVIELCTKPISSMWLLSVEQTVCECVCVCVCVSVGVRLMCDYVRHAVFHASRVIRSCYPDRRDMLDIECSVGVWHEFNQPDASSIFGLDGTHTVALLQCVAVHT